MRWVWMIMILIPAFVRWAPAQVRLGVSAGMNLARLAYEPRESYSAIPVQKSLPSYRVGGLLDITLASPFALQTGVFISGKGGKSRFTGNAGSYAHTLTSSYLEIPADLLVKPYITRDLRLYMGLGPYLGIGMGGKSCYSGTGVPGGVYTNKHTLSYGNGDNDDLKKRDFGGNLMAGFEFTSGFLIGVRYGISFTNNAPKANLDAPKTLRNKVFGLEVGYLFTGYRRWPTHGNYYYY